MTQSECPGSVVGEDRAFSELQSHYLFEESSGPGKATTRGRWKGWWLCAAELSGTGSRVGIGGVERHLLEQCGKRRERRLRAQDETIAERFERDRPCCCRCGAAYEACEKRTARVKFAIAGALSRATDTRCRPSTDTATYW